MNGCNWQNKSFSVALSSTQTIAKCKCGKEINPKHFHNKKPLCDECWAKLPSKGFGCRVDNFTPYYDQQLGTHITSLRQKVRLLEKKGLHYSEDNPKVKELRKFAVSYLGSEGKRRLDDRAKREFTNIAQKLTKQDLHERVDKSVEREMGREYGQK